MKRDPGNEHRRDTSDGGDSSGRVVLVTQHLPIVLYRDETTGKWRAEMDDFGGFGVFGDSVSNLFRDVLYVGCLHTYVPEDEHEEVIDLLAPLGCHPVFVDPTILARHIDGCCKGILWPAMHNIVDVYSATDEKHVAEDTGDCGASSGDSPGGTTGPALPPFELPQHELAASPRDAKGGVRATIQASGTRHQLSTVELAAQARAEHREAGGGSRPSSFPVQSTTGFGAQGEAAVQREALCSTQLWWRVAHADELWRAYGAVNMAVAEAVGRLATPGDTVWIHNYHLLLLPSFLQRKTRGCTVALFLHVPFPSSEIFRQLPMRTELLRGMLCANHIGFHLFEYARHFLTVCRRLLGLRYQPREGGFLGIEYNGRHVLVTCSHMGLQPRTVLRRLLSAPTRAHAEALVERYRGRRLLVGVDTNERLKGIPLKLLALERMLRDYPEWRGRVTLVQVAVGDSQRMEDDAQSRSEVRALAARVNRAYTVGGVRPVDLVETPMLSVHERMALWRVGEVFVSTPVREAVNLHAMEFVVARQARPGVVVLSEFSAASRILSGALRVNPWETVHCAEALKRALEMDPAERRLRRLEDVRYIVRNSTEQWVARVMRDVRASGARAASCSHVAVGMGLNYRVMELEPNFKRLDEGPVVRAYGRARRRLLLLDYAGTLLEQDSSSLYLKPGLSVGAGGLSRGAVVGSHASPSAGAAEDPPVQQQQGQEEEEGGVCEADLDTGHGEGGEEEAVARMIEDDEAASGHLLRASSGKDQLRSEETPLSSEVEDVLEALCADSRNTVFVVSGFRRDVLWKQLGHIRGLGIAAEYGYHYRYGADPPGVWRHLPLSGGGSGDRGVSRVASGSEHAAPSSSGSQSRSRDHRSRGAARGGIVGMAGNVLPPEPLLIGDGWTVRSSASLVSGGEASGTQTPASTVGGEDVAMRWLRAEEEGAAGSPRPMGSAADTPVAARSLAVSPDAQSGQTRGGDGGDSRSGATDELGGLAMVMQRRWMEVAGGIMALYAERTNATYVEHKDSAVLWRFAAADPEYGALQAKELVDHLEKVLAPYPVVVLAGKGYVEARVRGLDKGAVARHLLMRSGRRAPDFVLAVGDDVGDEDMFQAVNAAAGKEDSGAGAERGHAWFTAVVGQKPSEAGAYVDDVASVTRLLRELQTASERSKASASMVDLRSLRPEEGRGDGGDGGRVKHGAAAGAARGLAQHVQWPPAGGWGVRTGGRRPHPRWGPFRSGLAVDDGAAPQGVLGGHFKRHHGIPSGGPRHGYAAAVRAGDRGEVADSGAGEEGRATVSEDESAVGACIDDGAPIFESGSLGGQQERGSASGAAPATSPAPAPGTRRRSGRRGSGRHHRSRSGSDSGSGSGHGGWAGWVASLRRLARRLVRLARGKGARARGARLLLLAVALLALWLLR